MEWHDHSRLEGQHAFLSASKHAWVNYSPEKLVETYKNFQAVEMGTRLHALACEHIKLGIKMPKNNKTLNAYINDAIGFGMTPEQILYFSPNCFGTADAILFKKDFLRIHDLKTGTTRASMVQLDIYAALFCLEYKKQPDQIGMELRIYQNDQVVVSEPDPKDIQKIMDTIILSDQIISDIEGE